MMSSHHDYQFLSSKFDGITENEIEDSLLSGSPNIVARMRNNSNRLNMWRTEKNISLEDYNEISDYAGDYDHLDFIHDIAQNLKKAMSERSVLGLSNNKKRKFYHSVERDGSFDDDNESESVGINHQEVKEIEMSDIQNLNKDKRQTLDHTIGYDNLDSMNKEINSEIPNKMDEVLTVNKFESSENKRNNFSSNKANSLVDIDTIGGKVRNIYNLSL